MSQPLSPIATYDLHLHTCWSYDATADIASYFQRATDLGLRAISLTEHHNIDGHAETRAIAERFPDICWIPAAEMTVCHPSGRNYDLLCYGMPPTPTPAIETVMAINHQWQRARGTAVCRALQQAGCAFDEADHLALLRSYRPARVLEVQGATHIRSGLLRDHVVARGWFSDADQFRAALANGSMPPYPSVEDTVPALKAAGVLIVLAHPRAYFQDADINCMDALREELSLDGIECAHPHVPPELGAIYRDYCLRYNLISTAGSDSHDAEHLDTLFARYAGEARWLDELLERLPQHGA